jgi:hypothetical protein
MAFVDIGVGTAMLYGAGIGAGAGALYAGVTGGNVLNGALMGGGIGALGGAGAAGLAGASWGGAAAETLAAADTTAVGMGFSSAAEAISANPANAALLGLPEGTTAAQAAALGGSSSASAGFMGQSAAPNVIQAAGAANTANTLSQTSSAPTNATDPMQASQEGYNLPSTGNQYDTQYMGEYGGPQVGSPQAVASNVYQGGNVPQNAISGFFDKAGNWVSQNKGLTAAGLGAAYLLSRKNAFQPNYLPAYTPQSAASMGLNRTLASNYMPSRPMAKGGIASLADGGLLQSGPAQVNFMGSDMYPQSQINRSYYATPTQMPTSAQQTAASYEPKTNPLTGELTENMAAGGITAAGETGLQPIAQSMSPQYIQQLASQFGTTPQVAEQGIQAIKGIAGKAGGGSVGSHYNLGSYSDGGRLLKGPGDGMSDNIPASIADKQPARLADGEFVVPADVVSHLGNGSTDAGAKHLYKMMDNVRKARTGRKSQGKQIKADKYLPK